MAVAFRSLTNTNVAQSTSGTCAAPAGLADGDILVYLLYIESSTTVTWPSGFTQKAVLTASDSSFLIYVAWKRTASESGSYAPSWATSEWRAGVLLAISGAVASGDPFDVTPGTNAPGSETNTLTCAGITTVTDNALIVAASTQFNYLGATPTAPSGHTLRFGANGTVWAVSDALKTPAGSTGSLQFTGASATGQTAGFTIALKPAAGAAMRLPASIIAPAQVVMPLTLPAQPIIVGRPRTTNQRVVRPIVLFIVPPVIVQPYITTSAAIFVGAPRGATTISKAGVAVASWVASGIDSPELTKSGAAASLWAATGAKQADKTKTGSSISAWLASGAKQSTLSKAGVAVAIWSATATKTTIDERIKAGLALAQWVASGDGVLTLSKAGVGVGVWIASGADVPTMSKAGVGLASWVGSGSKSLLQSKVGLASSIWLAGASKALIQSKSGAALGAWLASGVKQSTLSKAGTGLGAWSAFGFADAIFSKAGMGAANWVAFGDGALIVAKQGASQWIGVAGGDADLLLSKSGFAVLMLIASATVSSQLMHGVRLTLHRRRLALTMDERSLLLMVRQRPIVLTLEDDLR